MFSIITPVIVKHDAIIPLKTREISKVQATFAQGLRSLFWVPLELHLGFLAKAAVLCNKHIYIKGSYTKQGANIFNTNSVFQGALVSKACAHISGRLARVYVPFTLAIRRLSARATILPEPSRFSCLDSDKGIPARAFTKKSSSSSRTSPSSLIYGSISLKPLYLSSFFSALQGALLTLLLTANLSSANTIDPKTRGLLDFIGSIEAPAGYDDYYRGVSSGLPQPLSSMTIGEVLAWQDSIDASSRSEAAGRYQIMEDTLRGLMTSKGIDKNRRFDSATQDELAVMLLKRRGWDPNRSDLVKMGNSIAHEWAALPICSGPKTEMSAYEGVAGNSAQTSCDAYLTVLEFGNDPQAVAWALTQSAVSGSVLVDIGRIKNILQAFITQYKEAFYSIVDNLVAVASNLLLSMILIEWVFTTALLVVNGAGIKEYLSALAFRIALGGAFMFIINLGNYSDLVIRSADGLLGQTTSDASINIIDLFDRVLAMSFDLFGRSTFGIVEKIAALLVLFIGTIIIALIIMSYMEVYLAFGAAIVVLGLGGFSQTRHIAINYMKRCIGRVFRLFTALFCGAVMSTLLTAELSTAQGDAMLLVGVLVILLYVILHVPSSVEQAVLGSISISASETLGQTVKGGPRSLAQKGGLPGA